MCHGFATVPPRHLVFRFFCLLAESFLVFECCLVVLILGGKTFSATAVLDWDVGGYSKPLDEHKNKVWQLKYIENNHCCSFEILRHYANVIGDCEIFAEPSHNLRFKLQ